MKKCIHCNDFAIYDDVIENCPLCGTQLVDYYNSNERNNTTRYEESPVINTTPVSRCARNTKPHLLLKEQAENGTCLEA